MSGLSKGIFSLLAVLLAGGCASTTLKTELARKDRKIKSLNSEIGLLREKNTDIARARYSYRGKFQSSQNELTATKNAELRSRQVIQSKDQQISLLKQRPTGPAAGSSAKSVKNGGGASSGGKYHLRIISLPKNSHNEKVVKQIAEHLRKRGISHVVPRGSGKFWVIDIGHFESIRTSAARDLQKTVRSLKYKGIRQFRDAIYVPY